MDKKTIGDLADYVNVNFRNESMAVSTGLDIISAALVNIRENIVVQQEGLKKMNFHIEAGELDEYLFLIDDLMNKSELYSNMFDISTEEEDFEFLDVPVDYGPEH
ncbi:MAG: hypothetical protein PHQ32_03755 [Firmicutes bacterium]|nr:hypothetical protein [Bacillota bacterium]